MTDKEIIYNYDVFISYRHLEEDKKWAKWLLESLETWRVPKELVKKGFPNRIGRVFRDEEELPSSSDLNKSIEKALIHSKYLVVICSKNTPESIWVEREIKMFKELGRFNRIIALLIDGEPYESFNKELTYIEENGIIKNIEPLAADVRKRNDQKEKETKQIALLKILSRILACNFDELRQREKLREKRKLRNKLLIAFSLLIVLISAILFTWDYNRVKTTYYNSFVYQYGIPKGIGKLTKSQYSKRTITYIFEEQRRTLKSVKRVNSYGRLRDDENNFNISIWIPEIDTRGGVKRVVCKDHNNKIVMIREYSADLKIIELQNEFNLPFISGGNEIVRYEVSYNDDGYVTNELYYRDAWNTPISDKDGFYGKRYEVDNNGVVTAEYGINFDGNVEANNEGMYKLQFNYDNNYNLIKEEFIDENNNLIYIGTNYGYSYIKKDYDKNGNLIKKSFFDENNQSIKSNYFGSASIVYDIDNRGNVTNITSYDENNNLFLTPYIIDNYISYCIHRMKYDDKGNIIEGSFYDVNTNKYITGEIYHKYKRLYDYNDNLIEESYYDKNDNLIICDDNYAIYRIKYDDKFNVIEESYYDTKSKPTIQYEYYHLVEYKYNQFNQITNKKYYGTNNKLVLGFYGFNSKFADTRIKYDRTGNVIEESYYDDNNNLILNQKNYAVRKISYGSQGLKTEESYYGTNNEPILITDQYNYFDTNKYKAMLHKIKYEYDTKGNVIEKSFYGTDNKLTLAKIYAAHINVYETLGDISYINAAKIKYEYSNSMLIKEYYFGTNNEPINGLENIYAVKYEYLKYDAADYFIKNDSIKNLNIIKTSFYDKKMNPIIADELNYHSKYEGSNYNNEVYIYCDTNDKLTINYQNIAYSIKSYLKEGTRTRVTENYGINNEPVLSYEKFFRQIVRFNDKYYIHSMENYGTNGEPVIGSKGYFYMTNTYDDNVNWVSLRLYGTNNELVLSKKLNYAIFLIEYDENNREIAEKYFDTNGNPTMNTIGYSSYKIEYDDYGVPTTNYYDEKGNWIADYGK